MKLITLLTLILLISCDHHGHGNKRFQKNVGDWVAAFENKDRDVFLNKELIIKALNLKKGETVADIGAGTGAFLKLLHDKVGPSGKVYAVDISEEFVAYMKKRHVDLTNLTVIKGATTTTKLPANSIDVAFICNTYHHFGDYSEMLKDIKKILKKNGRLYIIEYEKIPGKSRKWIMDHIRAEKKVFKQEIIEAGFSFQGELDVSLKENFIFYFSKL